MSVGEEVEGKAEIFLSLTVVKALIPDKTLKLLDFQVDR